MYYRLSKLSACASLALMLLLAGCAATSIRKPEVALVDLQFGEVSLFETNLEAEVRYDNDNSFPLELDGASHRIYLNDIAVGRALSDQALTIPAFGTKTQRVSVRVSNLTLFSRIQELVEAGRYDYRIESELRVNNGPFWARDLSVTNEGRVGIFDHSKRAGEV